MDWSVGQVLETLRREKLAKNTLVFFTSDNGPGLGLNLAGGSAGLLRGGKGSTWEGGTREPAIAWWPGSIQANVVNRELASSMDLFNTSLALAGVPLPTDRVIDGVDMTPMLLGKGQSRRQLIFYYHRDQLCAVRKGPFKLHLTQPIGGAPATPLTHPPPFLFQVENDPSERFDVASEHPDVLVDLLREVEKHKQNLIPRSEERRVGK